jgi:hypothetical protein
MADWGASAAVAVRLSASESCAPLEPVERVVQEKLEAIPTLFGRLILIAQLCRGLAMDGARQFAPACTAEELEAIFSRIHRKLFYKWLDKSFQFRMADMSFHFNHLGNNARSALTEMLDAQAYERLIPGNAGEPQTTHFILDVGILLTLVRSEL